MLSLRPPLFARCRREVWSATSGGRASELAMRSGPRTRGRNLSRAGTRWDAVHNAAQYLRETGQFQGELNFAYPTAVCYAVLESVRGDGRLG